MVQTFCRKFLWHELMLWPCDMPAHALVVLSHNDDLVPSPLVAAQLAQQHANATVLYHPTAGHGGFLVDLPFQRQMVQVRRRSLLAPSPSLHAEFCDLLRLQNSAWSCMPVSAGDSSQLHISFTSRTGT